MKLRSIACSEVIGIDFETKTTTRCNLKLGLKLVEVVCMRLLGGKKGGVTIWESMKIELGFQKGERHG